MNVNFLIEMYEASLCTCTIANETLLCVELGYAGIFIAFCIASTVGNDIFATIRAYNTLS